MTARFAPLALLLALVFLPGAAKADMRLCNRTSYILDTAIAMADGKSYVSRGWTRVAPGECEITQKGALKPLAYFIYARTSLAHSGPSRAWGGSVPICVMEADFSMRSPQPGEPCPGDTAQRLPFAAVDTGGASNWTVTLNESAAIKTMTDAQLTGVKRLLRDNGYNPGPLDTKTSRQTQAALDAFRKQMRFPQGATNADLFNALETEALKVSAPDGYAVCNETSGTLVMATAEKTPKETLAHGWWKIAAKSCSRLTSTPLAGDKFYLLARKDGKDLVGGPAKFCIADNQFDIRGSTDCVARGNKEAGFAETVIKGKRGYVAHINDEGLLAPLLRQTVTSK
jgi:uncharacterized membrane protein